ncbi:MAG: hypothetical protein Kow0045_04830 [Albidovulum sp.]
MRPRKKSGDPVIPDGEKAPAFPAAIAPGGGALSLAGRKPLRTGSTGSAGGPHPAGSNAPSCCQRRAISPRLSSTPRSSLPRLVRP